jgi:hypothetical protein
VPRHPERYASRRRPGSIRGSALAAAFIGALLLVTGCTGEATPSPPSPSAVVSSPSPSATPTATADPAPTLVAGGTAQDNLPFFRSIVQSVWASPDSVSGRAYIDALVLAGFDKAAMQVTSDTTTVGNPAESIQFSVKWADECLLGQVGPAIGEAVVVVVPALGEGTCLVGQTRPIDW